MTNNHINSIYKHEFQENGFFIIKHYFSEEKINYYTRQIEKFKNLGVYKEEEGFVIPDGITYCKEFWELIYEEKLIELLRVVLGDTLRYIRHSEVACDYTNTGKYKDFKELSGWHRDHRYRALSTKYFGFSAFDESTNPFKIAKIGVYLNSTIENKSPTVFFPKSHRDQYNISLFESYIDKIIKYPLTFLYRNKNLLNIPRVRKYPYFLSPSIEPIEIIVEKGDAIVFDPRLIHTGSPRSGLRRILWWDYGIENIHTYDYCKYWERERTDMIYGKIQLPDELKNLLIQKNLYLLGFENYNGESLTERFKPKLDHVNLTKLQKLMRVFS